MKLNVLVACVVAACLSGVAPAANVYVLSSGDPITDGAVQAALTSHGHTATIGVEFSTFDGSVDLSSFQTVYVQNNFNWTGAGTMPSSGAFQLVTWVNAGGRLVTGEWVTYYSTAGFRFAELGTILPAEATFSYGSFPSSTLTVVTPDATINAGVPDSFDCVLTDYAGTETFAVPKAGATSYYSTSNSATATALCGWSVGSGSVFSFLSTCGPDQVTDPNFGKLFSNVMGSTGPHCGTADFNGDGDVGTDQDIESFFECLAGTCCAACGGADFNADGDIGTDQDIESFFRVLAGGPC